MALEDLTGTKYIDALVSSNPVGSTDTKSTLDDHLRGIKNVLKLTFPNLNGAMTATDEELNKMAGLQAIKAELNILFGALIDVTELNLLNGRTVELLDTEGGQTIADLIVTGDLRLDSKYREKVLTYGLGGAITLDLNLALNFYPTGALTSIPTFTFSNPAITEWITQFTMELRNGANFAPIWPASVDWSDGLEPIWTSGLDVITFRTRDAGVTWYGFAAGLGMV